VRRGVRATGRRKLGKDTPAVSEGSEFESADRILQMTLAANLIAGRSPDANAYEMRNALLEQRRLARVRYKNGVTLPASAAKLRADAERKARHSRILARNIKNATGVSKHAEADAHHVVAQGDERAERSRRLLFGWAIGINDVDNGLFLPRKTTSKVPGLEGAIPHENIHTERYHLAVFFRLNDVGAEPPDQGRVVLRAIKNEVLINTFIY